MTYHTLVTRTRFLLSRPLFTNLQRRFSTKTSKRNLLKVDLSELITGTTNADLETNEDLYKYALANFPEYFEMEDDEEKGIELEYDLDLEPSHEHEPLQEDPTAIQYSTNPTIMQHSIDPTTNIRPLYAYSRCPHTEEGSRRCKSMRYQNLIPGILYGSDPTQTIPSNQSSSKLYVKTPWNLLQRELDLYTRHKFQSRVYDLTIYQETQDKEGIIHRVTPRDVQFHPILNKLYCINYLRYYPGRVIHLPIHYMHQEESIAMKRGGFIAPVSRVVPCVIDEEFDVPEHIELDCTGMMVGEVVRMDRLVFPEGVRTAKKVNVKEFLIGTCFGRRREQEAEEEDFVKTKKEEN